MSDMGDEYTSDAGTTSAADYTQYADNYGYYNPAEWDSAGNYIGAEPGALTTGSGSTGGFNFGSLLQSLFGGGQPGAPGSFNAMQTGTPATGYQASITAGPTPSAGTFFSEYGGYILGGGALLLLIAVLSKSGD